MWLLKRYVNWDSKIISSSQLVIAGECLFGGVVIFTDGLNDPTVEIHDSLTASGTVKLPSQEYDASAKTMNGFVMAFPGEHCDNGLFGSITTSGTCKVKVLFRLVKDL